jgi:hypothetical protein
MERSLRLIEAVILFLDRRLAILYISLVRRLEIGMTESLAHTWWLILVGCELVVMPALLASHVDALF